jgi:hypothetical protein
MSVPVAHAEAEVRRIAGLARRCYGAALGRNEHQEGRIGLRISVGPGGDVVGVAVRNQGLDAELARCVADAARQASFPADPNRGEATITTSFTFVIDTPDGGVPVR